MVGLLVCSSLLAGCTSGLDFTVDPRANLTAYPLQIQEGETVTFDARDSEPIEGVITDYQWDFGDGQTTETTTGFTSHRYSSFGIFTVELTVINSQGGADTATTTINVNGAPVLNLTYPESIRSGDSVMLDASKSTDPEGDLLRYAWDLDWGEDSDGDGDMRNDIDATTETVLLPTNRSGTVQCSLTVTDSADAFVKELFSLEIKSRKYEVSWETEEVEFTWDEFSIKAKSGKETSLRVPKAESSASMACLNSNKTSSLHKTTSHSAYLLSKTTTNGTHKLEVEI